VEETTDSSDKVTDVFILKGKGIPALFN